MSCSLRIFPCQLDRFARREQFQSRSAAHRSGEPPECLDSGHQCREVRCGCAAQVPQRLLPLGHAGATAPDLSLLDSELEEAIQLAIDGLPEAQRMAILLRRYEEMPYEELAEVMELSVPAVKSLLFRARTELRLRLRKYMEG